MEIKNKCGGDGMTDVTIQNDMDYLFIQWLGWDYNFWTVIFADIILLGALFAIIFIVGLIGVVFKWW